MKQCCRYMVAVCCLMLCSCAYVKQAEMFKIGEQCEKSIKDYNKLLRWREIESAGMTYLDPDLRDAFMKGAEEIKKRGITITDYRILTKECLPEKKTAEAVVEFDYYSLPSNRIKTLTNRQKWTYLDTEEKKGWQLKSGLPDFK